MDANGDITRASSSNSFTLPFTDLDSAQGRGRQGYLDAVDEDNEDTLEAAAAHTDATDSSAGDPPLDSFPDYVTNSTSVHTLSTDSSMPELALPISDDGNLVIAIDTTIVPLRRRRQAQAEDGELVEHYVSELFRDRVHGWLRSVETADE